MLFSEDVEYFLEILNRTSLSLLSCDNYNLDQEYVDLAGLQIYVM